MKKLFAFLTVTALLLSLAACGGAGKSDSSESDKKDNVTATQQNNGETENVPDESTSGQPDIEAIAETAKAKLIGKYNMSGVDDISLVFNEDGTGEYKFLNEKRITFTYLVYAKEGMMDGDCMIKMTYDTDEVEDNIFFFNRDTGNLCFHNSENGGYNGVIEYSEWMKK